MDKSLLLAKELMTAHNGHSDEEPSTFSEAAEELLRLRNENNDLLGALIDMVEIAELTIGWIPTPEGADGPLIRARAAIAKATGLDAATKEK